MGFKLPRLTRDVDCEAIGYPGIILTIWLNPPNEEWKAPTPAEPWDRFAWWHFARLLERIVIPGEYTDDGEEQVIELDSRQAVYDLANTEGFDLSIFEWAIEAYRQEKADWLLSERKN